MHVLKVRNVHQALPEGVRYILQSGVERGNRNEATLGKCLVAPCPVATVYARPTEKVEFWSERDANPFFHLFEAMWMLAGRQDVAYPSRFNQKFGQFSDDGVTFNGAYGFRWRNKFGFDQLDRIAQVLKSNHDDRRQVLSMWCPEDLANQNTKDVPCNTHVYFQVNSAGALDMTVCCRSNDIVWGAYGSNAVHFGFLIEYMAAKIGVPVGTYTQISNNWHAYRKTLDKVKELSEHAPAPSSARGGVFWDPYRDDNMTTLPLISSGESVSSFDSDLQIFLDDGPIMGIRSRFIKDVLQPLDAAYRGYSDRSNPDRFRIAMSSCEKCKAEDWREACESWLVRREQAAKVKEGNVG